MRLVIGGALSSSSPILDYYEGLSNVVFITAAGSNPTNDAKTIGKFFQGRGIKATWIPVYGSNCATRCFQEEYINMVKKADALYFSGGQSGSLQVCLFGGKQEGGTPLLEAIREVNIVGGSSAGAMVQPFFDILITGSSSASYQAVRDSKVYYRRHGNAFIKSGLVDVHFSERGRQGRLLVLAVATKTQWAFGIDENTAFKVVENGDIEIIGQSGGVVVFEDATEMTNANMHYLTNGDTISNGVISFASDKEACPSTTVPKSSNSIFSKDYFRSVSIAVARYSKDIRLSNHHGSNPAIEVILANAGVHTVCNKKGDLVSFSNMHVSMAPNKDYINQNSTVEDLDDQLWMLDI